MAKYIYFKANDTDLGVDHYAIVETDTLVQALKDCREVAAGMDQKIDFVGKYLKKVEWVTFSEDSWMDFKAISAKCKSFPQHPARPRRSNSKRGLPFFNGAKLLVSGDRFELTGQFTVSSFEIDLFFTELGVL